MKGGKVALFVAILALIVGGLALARPYLPALSGEVAAVGAGTRWPNGVSADGTSPSAGEVRGTTLNITSTAALGSSSDTLTRIAFGECIIHDYSGQTTIAASTTESVACQAGTGQLSALTNVPAWASGDVVHLSPATSTATTFGGLTVIGVNASTTAGYLEVEIANNTGDTFTWTATASSSWQYLFLR